MDSRLFTIGTLAERWGVDPKTIRTMVRKGQLAHFQVGKQVRFIETEIRKHEGWTTKSSSENTVDDTQCIGTNHAKAQPASSGASDVTA